MKAWLVVFQFVLLSASLLAQENLVRNPGFEETAFEKPGAYEIKNKDQKIKHWRAFGRERLRLYSSPKEYVAEANSGENAVGLVVGDPEGWGKVAYITGRLKTPLRKGQTYCVCFNLLLHRTSKWGQTDLGLLLHHDKDLIANISDPATLTAQLYANNGAGVGNSKWQQFCGYYTASGGEEYLSFGKFGQSKPVPVQEVGSAAFQEVDGYQNKAFYQLDDLSVKAIEDGSACGCATKAPEPPPVKKKPPPFLFALDASSSMNKQGLFDSLRTHLTNFVDQLPEGSPVSFVTFASGANQLFAGKKEITTASLVNQKLGGTALKGNTNALAGLQLAYASLPVKKADGARLVLITDGLFRVTPDIVSLVKTQFENHGRKLILIQIGSKALGLSQLKPYLESYVHSTAPEAGMMLNSLTPLGSSNAAVSCPCTEAFPLGTNYHFVVDYSGSMKEENSASLRGLQYLYDTIPDTAFVSVTLFNHDVTPVYAGPRSDLSPEKLISELAAFGTRGGTAPKYGVDAALKIARENHNNRVNALIIITDLATVELSLMRKMCRKITAASEELDLSASVVHFYLAVHPVREFNTMISQYDPLTQTFFTVSKSQFEEGLFDVIRLKCDYRSQPYHRGKIKRVVGMFLQEVQREYEENEYDWE